MVNDQVMPGFVGKQNVTAPGIQFFMKDLKRLSFLRSGYRVASKH